MTTATPRRIRCYVVGTTLYAYETGKPLRAATADEVKGSTEAAAWDGGAGVIEVYGLTLLDCPNLDGVRAR